MIMRGELPEMYKTGKITLIRIAQGEDTTQKETDRRLDDTCLEEEDKQFNAKMHSAWQEKRRNWRQKR